MTLRLRHDLGARLDRWYCVRNPLPSHGHTVGERFASVLYAQADRWRMAREQRDWEAADRIRDNIRALGWYPQVDNNGVIDLDYHTEPLTPDLRDLRERGVEILPGVRLCMLYPDSAVVGRNPSPEGRPA